MRWRWREESKGNFLLLAKRCVQKLLPRIVDRRLPKEILVVYHLPKKSGNFGWNVNGKMIFVSPNGNFHGKTGFLER